MKAKIRIPTEQYAYIEFEVEGPTFNDIEALRQEAIKVVSGGEGIPVKEFNQALDQYLIDGTGLTDTYVRMSKSQQHVFQEIKKSYKRKGID